MEHTPRDCDWSFTLSSFGWIASEIGLLSGYPSNGAACNCVMPTAAINRNICRHNWITLHIVVCLFTQNYFENNMLLNGMSSIGNVLIGQLERLWNLLSADTTKQRLFNIARSIKVMISFETYTTTHNTMNSYMQCTNYTQIDFQIICKLSMRLCIDGKHTHFHETLLTNETLTPKSQKNPILESKVLFNAQTILFLSLPRRNIGRWCGWTDLMRNCHSQKWNYATLKLPMLSDVKHGPIWTLCGLHCFFVNEHGWIFWCWCCARGDRYYHIIQWKKNRIYHTHMH